MNRTYRRAALAFALALATLPRFAAAQSPEPFSITLPTGFGAFDRQAKNVESPEGTIETTTWVSKSPTGEAVVITVSRMPAKILSPEKLFSGTRDSLLKSLGATLESEEAIDGEMPGTRLVFRSKGAFLRTRLLVRDDRFFQVLYVGRTEEQRSLPSVTQMFESFRVTL